MKSVLNRELKCCACNKVKPLSEFSSGQLSHRIKEEFKRCKVCVAEKNAAQATTSTNKNDGMKAKSDQSERTLECCACHNEKPLSDFGAGQLSRKIKDIHKRCKVCVAVKIATQKGDLGPRTTKDELRAEIADLKRTMWLQQGAFTSSQARGSHHRKHHDNDNKEINALKGKLRKKSELRKGQLLEKDQEIEELQGAQEENVQLAKENAELKFKLMKLDEKNFELLEEKEKEIEELKEKIASGVHDVTLRKTELVDDDLIDDILAE